MYLKNSAVLLHVSSYCTQKCDGHTYTVTQRKYIYYAYQQTAHVCQNSQQLQSFQMWEWSYCRKGDSRQLPRQEYWWWSLAHFCTSILEWLQDFWKILSIHFSLSRAFRKQHRHLLHSLHEQLLWSQVD